jgi:indolepyruvate ferredoxin oxidoreductase
VDYEALLAGLCEELDEPHFAAAAELAGLPDQIRGFGPIKQAAVETVGARREELVDAWQGLSNRLSRI